MTLPWTSRFHGGTQTASLAFPGLHPAIQAATGLLQMRLTAPAPVADSYAFNMRINTDLKCIPCYTWLYHIKIGWHGMIHEHLDPAIGVNSRVPFCVLAFFASSAASQRQTLLRQHRIWSSRASHQDQGICQGNLPREREAKMVKWTIQASND